MEVDGGAEASEAAIAFVLHLNNYRSYVVRDGKKGGEMVGSSFNGSRVGRSSHPKPVRTKRAGAMLPFVALCVAAIGWPVTVGADVYAKEGCQVTVPSGWVVSRTRVASPDKKMWASVMSGGSAAESVQVETGLKAVRVSEDARVILMASSASFAGLTNRQFHAITKTTPSCLADVTVPAGPMEASARAIALTIRPAR